MILIPPRVNAAKGRKASARPHTPVLHSTKKAELKTKPPPALTNACPMPSVKEDGKKARALTPHTQMETDLMERGK